MKQVFLFNKAACTAHLTRKQLLTDWLRVVEEFHNCYLQLSRQQHILNNCPSSQITQLMKAMRLELACLTTEVDVLGSKNQLRTHIERLQGFTQKAQVVLWLANTATC